MGLFDLGRLEGNRLAMEFPASAAAGGGSMFVYYHAPTDPETTAALALADVDVSKARALSEDESKSKAEVGAEMMEADVGILARQQSSLAMLCVDGLSHEQAPVPFKRFDPRVQMPVLTDEALAALAPVWAQIVAQVHKSSQLSEDEKKD